MDNFENASSAQVTADPIGESLAKERSLVSYVAIFALGIVSAYFLYFIFWVPLQPGGPAEWGQFGDFVGGLVNPVVGIATVILVVRTLRITRQEATETREQLAVQTEHLRQQVELAKLEQKLDRIQTRLDGALSDWNRQMDVELPKLTVPDTNGQLYRQGHGWTYGKFLHDQTLLGRFGAASKEGRTLVAIEWQNTFQTCVWILGEIEDYAREYDQASGDKVFTDYYRRRVQLPVRALMAAGLLREGNSLMVSLKWDAILMN